MGHLDQSNPTPPAAAVMDAARLYALLDAAVDGIVSIDACGVVLTVNPAAESMFGYTAAELVGRNVSLLMTEPDRSRHDGYLARYLSTGEKRVIGTGREVTGRRKDGTTFPLDLSVAEARVGEDRAFVGVLRDLTERKRAEAEVWESQKRYEQILDLLPVGILVHTAGLVVYHNPALARMVGTGGGDSLTGRPVLSLFHPRYHELIRRRLAQLHERPEPLPAVEEELMGRDGRTVPVEAVTAPFVHAGEPSILVVLYDLRERQEAEERFRTMVEGVRDYAIYSLDKDGRVTTWNPGAERLLGYHSEEAVGVEYARFFTPADMAGGVPARHLAIAAEHGQVSEEGWRVRRDGSVFLADVLLTPLWDRSGQLKGYVKVIRDVTERNRVETELRRANAALERTVAELGSKREEVATITRQLWQAAKLASVGELAASIAHELNNPMATVKLRLESVQTKTPADDPRRRALDIARQEVDRMAGLVANLLQFSRRGNGANTTVDVVKEVVGTSELINHHLRKAGVTVRHEFADRTPVICADRQKLRQVILNLLSNACDAMPRGGELTLRVGPDELPHGRAAVRFEVADTGVGIPPEHLAAVTEPFFTTKEEGRGTGLGLAICRRIVEEHQGELAINSTVGVGTTVRVLLPTQPENGSHRPRRSPPAESGGGS
ncbi:MAG: PAS domain S-box protein [Fimbriiglobus sp.]|nr:PAS domain S-box protein [Fimbriiglobus sp.]